MCKRAPIRRGGKAAAILGLKARVRLTLQIKYVFVLKKLHHEIHSSAAAAAAPCRASPLLPFQYFSSLRGVTRQVQSASVRRNPKEELLAFLRGAG